MTLLIIYLLLHHQFAMTSNILSSNHPCYSYLQTVHHAIMGAMVRLLTDRKLSLPSSNLAPVVGMSEPGQVSHASKVPQLEISLLSTSILYSGATPGKVLKMMNHVRAASISDRTFYYHQN